MVRYNMEIGSTYSRLPEFYGREIKIEPINRRENFITKKDSGNNRQKTAEGTGKPKRRSKKSRKKIKDKEKEEARRIKRQRKMRKREGKKQEEGKGIQNNKAKTKENTK